MELIFKHAWIIFIAATVVNGYIMKLRSKKYVKERPELGPGYEKYIKGWMLYGNIPWVLMMIGNVSGMTQSIIDYFNPRSLNPMVLTFHLAIIMLWIAAIRWIYFKKGAEFIENHPGLFQKSSLSGNTNMTAKQVKMFTLLMLLGGIVGMVMMWTMDFSTPTP